MAEKKYTYEEMRDWFLALRNIEPGDECKECGGSGIQCYGSTATWRGGIGGMAMTSDVCDKCWGSGDKTKPWPDRRKMI